MFARTFTTCFPVPLSNLVLLREPTGTLFDAGGSFLPERVEAAADCLFQLDGAWS